MANFYHVVNVYPAKTPDEKIRNDFAAKTWDTLYKSKGVIPVHLESSKLPQNSKVVFKDTRKIPFVKNLINHGVSRTKSINDIIIFTNTDICLLPDITTEITQAFLNNDAVYNVRHETYKYLDHELNREEVKKLEQAIYCADTFCFKVKWWKKWQNKLPNFILGCQWWDVAFMDLITASNSQPLIYDVSYHVKHNSMWSWSQNWYGNPGQQWNKRLALQFKNPNKNSWMPKALAYDNKMAAQAKR